MWIGLCQPDDGSAQAGSRVGHAGHLGCGAAAAAAGGGDHHVRCAPWKVGGSGGGGTFVWHRLGQAGGGGVVKALDAFTHEPRRSCPRV